MFNIVTRENILGKANMKHPLLFAVLNDVPTMANYYSNVDRLCDLWKKNNYYDITKSISPNEKLVYTYITNAIYILISYTKDCKLVSIPKLGLNRIRFNDRRAGSIACFCDEDFRADISYNTVSKHKFDITALSNARRESDIHNIIQEYASNIIQWLNDNRISNDFIVYYSGKYVKVSCIDPKDPESIKVINILQQATDFEKVFHSLKTMEWGLIRISDAL